MINGLSDNSSTRPPSTCRTTTQNIALTTLLSAGSTLYKSGNSIIFVNNAAVQFTDNLEWVKILGYSVLIPAVLYTKIFTRIKSVWKIVSTFKKNPNRYGSHRNNKYISVLARVITVARATFLSLNTYASTTSILDTVQINNPYVLFPCAIYASISYFVVFNVFDGSKISKNSQLLYRKIQKSRVKQSLLRKNLNRIQVCALVKTIAAGILGIAAYGARSYFLTQNTFGGSIPWLNITNEETRNRVAFSSTSLTLVESILAKGIDLYLFFSRSCSSYFAQVHPANKSWVTPHTLFGSIFVLGLGLGFFMSAIKFLEAFDVKYQNELIPVYLLFAVSGCFLEFAFNPITMLNGLRNAPKSNNLRSESAPSVKTHLLAQLTLHKGTEEIGSSSSSAKTAYF